MESSSVDLFCVARVWVLEEAFIRDKDRYTHTHTLHIYDRDRDRDIEGVIDTETKRYR